MRMNDEARSRSSYLREDLAAHVSLFHPAPEASPTLESPIQHQQGLRCYRVNVVVEHGASDGTPVVVETDPTYQNLIGRIEKESQFGELTNLVRVASYWAGQAGAATVSANHVQSALDQQIYRSNLYEERIQELITRDILLVDVAGEAVGQVNGLAVRAFADYQFGRPSRITASVGVGLEGVVDVEREAQMDTFRQKPSTVGSRHGWRQW